MGFLRYGKPGPSGTAPLAPVLAITSPVSVATPSFTIYGEFAAGGDLQFERQVAGLDWSSPTVANHTITSGEIAGSAINYSLAALTAGNYEFRAKYTRPGSVYSSYSPTEYATIDFSLLLTYKGKVVIDGTAGGTTKTFTAFPIGNAFANRRVYLAACFLDGSSTVAVVRINGTSTGVTVYQAGTGANHRWLATALVPSGTTMDVEVQFSAGSFGYGHPACYVCDNSTVTNPAPHDDDHAHITSGGTNSFTMNVDTLAGGVIIQAGNLQGATSIAFSSFGGDDEWNIDTNVPFSAIYAHSDKTLARTSAVITTWGATGTGDVYGNVWSIR